MNDAELRVVECFFLSVLFERIDLMQRVKIYGAGSIGNHLAHAARHLGWDVVMCDIDPAALNRTKVDIYPKRYGRWDDGIQLTSYSDVPTGGFDLIIIGTPPNTHMELAMKALKEKPGAMLIEKPLCTPNLAGASEVYELSKSLNIPVFTGYNHVVGHAARFLSELCQPIIATETTTLDVEFREHWGGIFNAHPWLKGPNDTYLGFSDLGGGATGEHSHAINFWQFLSYLIGAGRIVEVQATMNFVYSNEVDYDDLSVMTFKTETGLLGRCVQDVITRPARKFARIQLPDDFIEWHCNAEPELDKVIHSVECQKIQIENFEKTRPIDFICELEHIVSVVNRGNVTSPISLKRGLETMLVVAAAYKSAKSRNTVKIDYTKGFNQDAIW